MHVPRANMLVSATFLAVIAMVSSAWASSTASVLSVYERTGAVPACDFSSPQLAGALKNVDPSQAQYFSDFTNAVQGALSARASGVCAKPAGGSSPAVSSGAVGGSSPRSVTAATSASLPAPIVLMAILAGLVGIVATLGGAARARDWSPAWADGWRQAWSEAGYRVGGLWSEFLDWLRARP